MIIIRTMQNYNMCKKCITKKKLPVSLWCGTWNKQLIGPEFHEWILTAIKNTKLILNGILTGYIGETIIVYKKYAFSRRWSSCTQGYKCDNLVNFDKLWIGLNGATE